MTEAFFLKAVGLFLIALVRFSGFFINLPVFGETIIPTREKAGLSALCTLLVLPHLMATQELPELSVFGYGIMAVKEIVLGLIMSFVVLMNIDSLRLAGQLMGMQIGFSFVQVVDPNSGTGQAILSEFIQVLGLMVFLMVNGHLLLLQGFTQSFELVPLAGLTIRGGVVAEVVRISTMVFWFGLQVSMPIFAVILVGDVALGIIARTVPKLNVFQVGFALKVMIGFITLALLLPFVNDQVKALVHDVYGEINMLLNKM